MEDNLISLAVVAGLIALVGISGTLLDRPIKRWLDK